MKIAITGSSGLIGSAALQEWTNAGHEVIRLVRRRQPGQNEVQWKPERRDADLPELEGCEAVVHLAGENVGSGRWSVSRKKAISDSRVLSTQGLCSAFAKWKQPPAVFLCASAIGYYGNRGAEMLREDSTPGTDFLSDVCRNWEAATEPAAKLGIRVVNLRFGVVLSPEGGALPKMLPPFRLGFGGPLGNGRQYMSWISRDDAAGALDHALRNGELQGPVNVVSPAPATNREFSKTLGRVLRRPAFLATPAPVLRLLLGEMAEALLLSSTRVDCAKLVASGYRFRHPDLEEALRSMLKKS